MSKRILLTTISVLVVLLLSLAIVAPASADQSVTVTVLDSQGNAIPSVTVQFSQNNFSTYVSTTTNGAGVATKDLADGTWKVRALYHNTSAIQTLDTNDSNSLTFYTSQSEARVYKHDGTPFPDVLVRFSPSSGFGVYVSANTDSTGLATAELFPATVYLRASVSGTSADQSMALAGDSTSYGQSSLVTFYTSESRVVVQNCSGSPKIEGARAQFFHDGTHGTYVSVYTDANGVASTELFPGSHDVQASMNFTAEIKTYTLAGDGKTAGQSTTTTFNPTKVAFAYNGPIHIWTGSYWATFTNPSYMFSATVKFRFGGGGGYEVDVPISGCEMEKTAVTIKLLDSGSHGLDGGIAQYNLGGWQTAGTTNSDGEVFVLIDGLQNTLAFRMYWEDTYIQKNQNVSVDSTVVFQTVLVKMELHSSSGAQLEGEGQVNSGAWKTLGNTPTAGKELLPKTYAFRIYYEDTYIQKNQNVDDGNTLVVFDTVLVKMELHSSLGAQLTGEGQVNSGSWKTLGDTPTAGKELLPKTYAFRIYYEDTYVQKNQNVADDPLVVFETVRVQMELHSSSGAQLTGEGQVNSGNWKTMGLTPTASNDGGKELLPKTYAFRIYYEDTYIQKNQNVSDGNNLVVFDTVLVTMKLLDADNNELAAGAQVNSGSWKTFGDGTTTTTMELLPKTYAFRVYYEDTYIQMNQNVGADPIVIFRGTAVTIQFTGNIQYNSGGWKTFTKPTMTLLPKTYAFRFSAPGYPTVQKNIQITGSEMQLSIAYIMLLNSAGNPIAGGEGQYNVGGWQSAGNSNSQGVALAVIDGLQNTLAFRMYYEDTYIQKNQNIANDSFVIFQTVLVKMELHSSLGAQLTGEGQVNSGSWKSLGNTPTAGKELLPKTYAFRIYYEDTYIEKSQNVGNDPLVVFDTVLVKMELHSSQGTQLTGEGQVDSGSWKSLGNTPTAGMELLPKTYAFRIYYEDTYIQKNQNVASDPLVVFETVLVKMELHSSSGGLLTGEGQVNSGTWKSLGNTPTAGMELLPATYAFRIYYEDTYIQKNQNVASDPLVIFETVLVKMELHSSSGAMLTGEGQVNSGTWKSLGNTPTAGMELLPATYAFRIYYEDTYIQENQNVASDQLVVFNTVLVTVRLVDSGSNDLVGDAQVNSGTWKSLGNTPTDGKELLPTTYAFRVYYDDTYTQKNQNVSGNPEVIFTQ